MRTPDNNLDYRPPQSSAPSIFSKGWFWGLLAVVGGAVAMFFVASNIGSSRDIVVVNGLNQALIVKVDDRKPMQIQAEKYSQLKGVAEGTHTVEIIEPAKFAGKKDFSFSTGFFNRIFRKPVFVLDPTESGIVVWEETVYSANPVDEDKYEFKVGELFSQFDHADYPFQKFPDSIEVDSNTSKVRKSRVDFTPFNPAILLTNRIELSNERQMELTERWLEADVNDMDRLGMYMMIGAIRGQSERCEKFLETKLDERPLMVELHRAYQTEAETHGHDMAELKKRYDDYIAAEPNSADLVYLRGRLENDKEACDKYFQKALEIDPKHWHAIAAIAYNEMATMNFEAASRGYRQAKMLNPDDEQIQEYFVETLFATKNYSALRSNINLVPTNLSEFKTAANFLTATGEKAALNGLMNGFQAKQKDSPTSVRLAEIYMAYLNKNYAGMKTKANQLFMDFEKVYFQYQADVEMKNFVEAERHLKEFAQEAPDFAQELIAISAKLAGNDDAANKKLEEVLQHMDTEGPLEKQQAAIIRRAKNGDVNVDEIKNLMMEPHRKKILAAVVKVFSGKENPQLDQMINTLNYDLDFPHNLIQQTVRSGSELAPR